MSKIQKTIFDTVRAKIDKEERKSTLDRLLLECGKTKDEFVSTLHQSINTEDKIKHLPIILSYIEHLKLKIVPYKYSATVWGKRYKKRNSESLDFNGTVFASNKDDAAQLAKEQIEGNKKLKHYFFGMGLYVHKDDITIQEIPTSDFADFEKNLRVEGNVDFTLGSTDNWQDWLKYATEAEVKDCLADIFKTCKTRVLAEKVAA